MSTLNRLANCHNSYQGEEKRVLCVCSAGLLRSPTMARVLAEKYNYNTRAAGITEEYALISVDDVLVEWADEFVVAENWMGEELIAKYPKVTSFISLNLPDIYGRMDLKLVSLIKERYEEVRIALELPDNNSKESNVQ